MYVGIFKNLSLGPCLKMNIYPPHPNAAAGCQAMSSAPRGGDITSKHRDALANQNSEEKRKWLITPQKGSTAATTMVQQQGESCLD